MSGSEVIQKLASIGFSVTRQKGSHVRMSRLYIDTTAHVSIPNHTELDRGTQKSIIRSITPFLTEKEIKDIFYTE